MLFNYFKNQLIKKLFRVFLTFSPFITIKFQFNFLISHKPIIFVHQFYTNELVYG